jgi:hypothetical protein
MKTFTLFFLLFISTTTAFTQIKKGQYLLGGSANFESKKEEYSINPTYTTSNFIISPAFGYFIVDNMAGGLRLNLGFYNGKSDDLETHYITTTISPFVRFYFLPAHKKVNAFIDVSYIHNKTGFNAYSDSAHYEKAKGYSISAGPAIFLTEQIALEFTVGYKHTLSDNFDQAKSTVINSGLGLQIHFGENKNKRKNKYNH